MSRPSIRSGQWSQTTTGILQPADGLSATVATVDFQSNQGFHGDTMRIAKPEIPLPTAIVVPEDNRILYYGRDRAVFRFLSHFYTAPIELDGERWTTVEHFYQAQKSHEPAYKDAIRNAQNAAFAKQLAAQPTAPRKISKRSWFKEHARLPRSDWNEVKLDIMRRADLAKFTQHPELAKLLVSTGDAHLVEDSESEPFWGIGFDETA